MTTKTKQQNEVEQTKAELEKIESDLNQHKQLLQSKIARINAIKPLITQTILDDDTAGRAQLRNEQAALLAEVHLMPSDIGELSRLYCLADLHHMKALYEHYDQALEAITLELEEGEAVKTMRRYQSEVNGVEKTKTTTEPVKDKKTGQVTHEKIVQVKRPFKEFHNDILAIRKKYEGATDALKDVEIEQGKIKRNRDIQTVRPKTKYAINLFDPLPTWRMAAHKYGEQIAKQIKKDIDQTLAGI